MMPKYLMAWLVMLVVAVTNGAVREFSYGKHMSELAAHQVSTITGAVLLGLVIRAFVRAFPFASTRQAVSVGLLWASLTVTFEFLFFHFVGGYSWAALAANYNAMEGRVWVFLIAWIAVAPSLFHRLNRQLA